MDNACPVDLVSVNGSGDENAWSGFLAANHPDWHENVVSSVGLRKFDTNILRLAWTNGLPADS